LVANLSGCSQLTVKRNNHLAKKVVLPAPVGVTACWPAISRWSTRDSNPEPAD
jgi:hypothetical protein